MVIAGMGIRVSMHGKFTQFFSSKLGVEFELARRIEPEGCGLLRLRFGFGTLLAARVGADAAFGLGDKG